MIICNGTYYLFFAANTNDDDDIFMSIFIDGSWSSPIMVHPDNTVPDILPHPNLVDGELSVSWQQYDGDQYVLQRQLIDSPLEPTPTYEFQKRLPQHLPGKAKVRNGPEILQETFQLSLLPDFHGIGLIRGYSRQNAQHQPFQFRAGSF